MAKKVIAVQEGLHEIAELLKNDGYEVTSVDDHHRAIDVIVYSSRNQEYLAHNNSGTINLSSNNQFVRMINVDEVGIDNIKSSIEELQ